MKLTLSWLKDHLETTQDLTTISQALNAIGLEVERIEDPAQALKPFRTAIIISAERHPNADRLQVCRINAGPGFEDLQVVCGAPNARAGLITVFAPVGTYIPGSDITLKAGKIRGEISNGMMCSARELMLSDAHDGIIELPVNTPIGQSFVEVAQLDDPIIEIAITPNRGDALSIRNIARDLAAAGLGELKPLSIPKVKGSFPSAIYWDNQFPQTCLWIIGRTIRNVRNGQSPEWLQKRLKAIGVQPKNFLVDVTNYFTFDLGRPLHVFDADKIHGDHLTLCRGNGEVFMALNGKEYQVTNQDCIIADQQGVQSLAGLIGGQDTAVDENTTHVFLECALFNPNAIALSGRHHFIHTDARQRFELGIDQSFILQGLDLATKMIIDYAGGEASEPTSAGSEPQWQRQATLRFAQLPRYGGLAVSPHQTEKILKKLGFGILSQDQEQITVSVPSWRNDIAMPVKLAQHRSIDASMTQSLTSTVESLESERDLIEEVLRIVGLDHIPAVSLPTLQTVPAPALNSNQKRSFDSAHLLAQRGLIETINFSFVDHEVAARLGEAPESLRLLNPIANDMDQLRSTPLASLLPTAQRNIARGLMNVAIFEVGPVFRQEGEQTIAAGLRYGHMPRSVHGHAEPVSVWDVKEDIYFVLNGLGVACDALQVTADTPIYYHPGRSGRLSLGPKQIFAFFGELHPSLVKEFGFDQAPMVFEIMIDAVKTKRSTVKPLVLSAFQPVKRDFAFVVAEKTSVGNLIQAAKQADLTMIAAVELFDIYRGEHIEPGNKSVAIQVTLQPQERSLRDEEIEAISQKIIAKVHSITGGTLR